MHPVLAFYFSAVETLGSVFYPILWALSLVLSWTLPTLLLGQCWGDQSLLVLQYKHQTCPKPCAGHTVLSGKAMLPDSANMNPVSCPSPVVLLKRVCCASPESASSVQVIHQQARAC